jgi:hypothetical protein
MGQGSEGGDGPLCGFSPKLIFRGPAATAGLAGCSITIPGVISGFIAGFVSGAAWPKAILALERPLNPNTDMKIPTRIPFRILKSLLESIVY